VRDEVDPVLGRIVLQYGHYIARSSVSVTFKMLVIVIMRGKNARCTTTVFLSVSVSVHVRNITFLANKSIVPIGSKVYF
jgi:acyl-CoA hydrolase